MDFVWIDKVDGVDEVRAADINSIAAEIPNRMSTAEYVGEEATQKVYKAEKAEQLIGFDVNNTPGLDAANTWTNTNTYYGEYGGTTITGGQIVIEKSPDYTGDDPALIVNDSNININNGKLLIDNVDVLNNISQDIITMGENIGDEMTVFQEETQTKFDNKADILVLQSDKSKTLSINDSTTAEIVNYKVYGESTQSGTPTFDVPIDVVSVGEWVQAESKYKINVTNNSVAYDVLLAEQIRKIGTYEDYLDYSTQKLIRNNIKYVITGAENWATTPNWSDSTHTSFYISLPTGMKGSGVGLSNCYTQQPASDLSKIADRFVIGASSLVIIADGGSMTPATFKSILAAKYASGNPAYIIAQRTTPLETSIELDGIGNTAYPTTTITSNGLLQIQYKADTTNAYYKLKGELDTMKQAIISLGGTL